MTYLVLREQSKGRLGGKPPLVAQNRLAKIKGGQEGIPEPASPGPVGWRPEAARIVRVPVLACNKTREIADHGPMGNARALGRTRCATRIDELTLKILGH